jgi:hypothetical protein
MEKGNGDFVSVCPTLYGRLADFFLLLLGSPYVSGCLGVKRCQLRVFLQANEKGSGKEGNKKMETFFISNSGSQLVPV